MSFIHDDFLLGNQAARKLYHEYAAAQPIIDYHNHLPPAEIAERRRFANLFEIWLEGDHYKWRAMRANGVDERFCTGDASPREKFQAWARTVPFTLRNPLYHWTHLELKRYFDLDLLLSESTADQVWQRAAQRLADDDLNTHGILRRFQVAALCTTDDPVDDLSHHQAIARDKSLRTRVYPAYRPDRALFVHDPTAFNAWIDQLAAVSNVEIRSLDDFLTALRRRHDFFHEQGARLSDHGMSHVPASFCDDQVAGRIFSHARSGRGAAPDEHEQFSTYMLQFFARLDAERGWTKQFHVGVLRNNNSRLFRLAGRDVGCDSIGDAPQAASLGAFLDRLDRDGMLPKTIVYNLNPADNYLCCTMLGNFQDGRIPGKMQFGSGWWYSDQKEAMEWQLNTLSNTGLLSRFIGMLTDSRSFMSFPRHEYFRRVLCNLLGQEMEAGLVPDDLAMIGELVQKICYTNARDYLGLAGA